MINEEIRELLSMLEKLDEKERQSTFSRWSALVEKKAHDPAHLEKAN